MGLLQSEFLFRSYRAGSLYTLQPSPTIRYANLELGWEGILLLTELLTILIFCHQVDTDKDYDDTGNSDRG